MEVYGKFLALVLYPCSRICNRWGARSSEVAEKVKHFFKYSSINRHKMTVQHLLITSRAIHRRITGSTHASFFTMQDGLISSERLMSLYTSWMVRKVGSHFTRWWGNGSCCSKLRQFKCWILIFVINRNTCNKKAKSMMPNKSLCLSFKSYYFVHFTH